MFRRILVATHGTDGAKNAESYAIGLAMELGAELHGLYVINKDWGSLVGIEWLHSSDVRMEFYRYAETEFYLRAKEVLDALREDAGGMEITTAIKVGELTEVIADEARNKDVNLIIIGSGSNKRSEEYKAKISLKKLFKLAPCPVLVTNNDSSNSSTIKNWWDFIRGVKSPL